jgi:hypothetical protein
MSSSELDLAVRVAMPEYLEVGRQQVVSLALYHGDEIYPPEAVGSARLYSAAGVLLLTKNYAVGANDMAQLTLTAVEVPATTTLGRGAWLEFDIEAPAGRTRTYRRDVVFVRQAIRPTLTHQDVIDLSPVIAASLRSGQTVQGYITEAWYTIIGRLEQAGVFPSRIVDYWVLRALHIELTQHLICQEFALRLGAAWADRAASHRREFEMGWAKVNWRTASRELAEDSDARKGRRGVIMLNASPGPNGWGSR